MVVNTSAGTAYGRRITSPKAAAWDARRRSFCSNAACGYRHGWLELGRAFRPHQGKISGNARRPDLGRSQGRPRDRLLPLEKLHNLDALAGHGFTVSCFPVKIRGARPAGPARSPSSKLRRRRQSPPSPTAQTARLPVCALATIRPNILLEVRLIRREERMDRRSFVAGSAAAAAAPAACAQEVYPSRAITVINPFPPGGAADVVARPLAAVLEPLLKQPVVIETKAGAAGQVGAQFAASAKPDGYTLLVHIVSISGFAEVDKLYGRPVKFTRDDFIPDRALSPIRWCCRQRPAALQDAHRPRRRRQEAPQRAGLQLVGHARRAASADRPVPAGGGPADEAPADQRRRPGADRADRQQLAGVVSAIAAAMGQIKAGKARALASSGRSARPRCPMCRP